MKRFWWVVLAALLLVPDAGAAGKSYTAGHFLLSLDGEPALLKRVDPPKKNSAGVSLEVELDRVGSDAVWGWLQAALSQSAPPKNLIVQQSADQRIAFQRALISEITFPKLDSASKLETSVKLVIVADKTAPASKEAIKGPVNLKQKKFLPSNFRVRIGDLPTSKVKKIDAVSWKMNLAEKPGKTEITPLSITLDSADAAPWAAWLKSKQRRAGSIQLTDDDGKAWRTLKLEGLSLTSLKTTGKSTVAVIAIGKISLD